MQITANLTEFYNYFPEFNTETYQPIVEVWFNDTLQTAAGWNIKRFGKSLNKAIYLLTAHICKLRMDTTSGQGAGATGQVASANVDGVNVSFNHFQSNNFDDYYLQLTPYGLMLLDLLNKLTAVPTYHGGSFERVF